MSSSFDDLLDEAADAGVDPDLIARFRAASEASPLRKENKELKEQIAKATERASRAETASLTTTFEKLGIKGKPTAYNLPDDLDRTDFEAVQGWAVENGFADPPKPNVPDEHLDAQDRIQAAADGAGLSPDTVSRALATDDEEEFWKLYSQAGDAA